MTDAHTPGPWTLRRMHTGGFDIMDWRNRDVATVYGGGVETESREANARLIAAAPDLLEALDGIIHFSDGFDFYRTQSPAGKALEEWIGAAREAIAKATTTEQGERG